MNIELSEARCQADHIEFRARVIKFGNIRCKKDEVHILEIDVPILNEMIHEIE